MHDYTFFLILFILFDCILFAYSFAKIKKMQIQISNSLYYIQIPCVLLTLTVYSCLAESIIVNKSSLGSGQMIDLDMGSNFFHYSTTAIALWVNYFLLNFTLYKNRPSPVKFILSLMLCSVFVIVFYFSLIFMLIVFNV